MTHVTVIPIFVDLLGLPGCFKQAREKRNKKKKFEFMVKRQISKCDVSSKENFELQKMFFSIFSLLLASFLVNNLYKQNKNNNSNARTNGYGVWNNNNNRIYRECYKLAKKMCIQGIRSDFYMSGILFYWIHFQQTKKHRSGSKRNCINLKVAKEKSEFCLLFSI